MSHLLGIVIAAWLTAGGVVRDAVTREPIAGVTVLVPGTAHEARSDASGRFSLDVPPRARLRFIRAGYVPLELAITGGDTALAVTLTPMARALESVTVTALRGGDETPVSRSTLDRSQIEARSFGQEMPLLLASTPAMTAYSDGGAFSNYAYMRLRGIDQTRINITLDGIPLNDAEDQVFYFSNLPDFANSIESVEIQRGVGTSSNGTASYAGGVSFESIALGASGARGEVQVGHGSYDSYRASAEYHTGLRDARWAAYTRVSGQRTDGFRRHSGNRSSSVFASGGWFGTRTVLKLTAVTGDSRNDLAYVASALGDIERDPRDNPLPETDRDHFTQHLVGATATRALGETSSLSATAYTVQAGGDYDVTFGDEIWNFGLESAAHGLIANWKGGVGRLRATVGAHGSTYHRDHTLGIRPNEGALLYSNTGHKDETAAFAKVAYERRGMTLFGDLQWRTAEFRYEPDANAGIDERSIRWTFVNPKVGFSVAPSRGLRLYAALGRNRREPARNDMFAGFDNLDTSNVDFIGPLSRVRPERVTDGEAGAAYATRTLSVKGNLFLMRFRDEIAPIGALSYIGLPLRKNVRSSERRGIEIDAEYRGIRRLIATANATLSRNRIAEYTDDATGVTYRDVEPLLTPRVIVNHVWRYAVLPRLSVSLAGRHVGRSYLANTGDADFVTPASHLFDAGAAWATAGGRYAILLQVNNVTSATAYPAGYTDGVTSYYYRQAPRNAFLTARIGF